ncbi:MULTISPECIES: hypothetical protein [Nocardiopsis]|uniref:hypothetical protein n=1 Tax=Nocardiopsis TaxID=2013 RepID=UPI0033366FF5
MLPQRPDRYPGRAGRGEGTAGEEFVQLIGFQTKNGRFEYLRFQQSQERQRTVDASHGVGNERAPRAAQDGFGRGHRIQRPVTVR